MKKSLLLALIVLTLSLCGCTHNDGDIGTLFGEWTMTDIKVDGVTDNIPLEIGYVWAFQSHVICIKELKQHNEFNQFWGTWQQEGDILTIDYTNGTKPAPEDIFMTDSKMPMEIIHQTNKYLILSYQDPQGSTIVYTLKKQW